MELVGKQADDGEEGDEVSEIGNDLGVPDSAHGGDAQHFAHG